MNAGHTRDYGVADAPAPEKLAPNEND